MPCSARSSSSPYPGFSAPRVILALLGTAGSMLLLSFALLLHLTAGTVSALKYLTCAAVIRVRNFLVLCCMLLCSAGNAAAAEGNFSSDDKTAQQLTAQLAALAAGKDLTLGVAAALYSPDGTLLLQAGVNADRPLPLMSLIKVPVALSFLSALEQNRLPSDSGIEDTESLITMPESSLHENTWSPLKKEHPQGDLTLSAERLLFASTAQSDNNACDELIRLQGGMGALQDYLFTAGFESLKVTTSEYDMQDLIRSYENTGTASDLVQLLRELDTGNLLQETAHTKLMLQHLKDCSSGSNKLPAALPADSGIILAHKTGSSGRLKGLKIAENDMGIFYLPDGSRLYLAVLVSDSALSDEENCALIRSCGEIVLSTVQNLPHGN